MTSDPSLALAVLDWAQLAAAATPAPARGDGWLSRNATLVVGVVGIVVSGFVGPTVAAILTSRREYRKDLRALAVERQADLRMVLDDAAGVLSSAIGKLRPLLAASLAGDDLPKEPADFLGTLAPLGYRLHLRLPDESKICTTFDAVVVQLRAVATATSSQEAFAEAVSKFETKRTEFMDASRAELRSDVFKRDRAQRARGAD